MVSIQLLQVLSYMGGEKIIRRILYQGVPFAGKNICNETAFILQPGESGTIKYNYRLTVYLL